MADMDRYADTADPEDEDQETDPEDPDTADPENEDPDEEESDETDANKDGDTAAPTIRRTLQTFLSANGGRPPTNEQLTGLLSHAYKKGTTKQRRLVLPPSVLDTRRPLTPRVRQVRNHLFRAVRRKHGGRTITSKGYYYGTAEVVFSGVGDGHGAALLLNPTTIKFFHEAVDDKVHRLADGSGAGGIPYVVTAGDTNLQYPGKNLYPREVFIISHIGLEFCGMRVMYDPAEIQNLTLDPAIREALTGNGTLWDDGMVFLPGELLNDYSGRCRLIDAMYPTGVLYFVWDKKQAGGNRDVQELLISPLQKIPVTRMSLNETSGGANLLEMHEGYVWSLDQQTSAGRAGIFEARIRTHERVTFPIKPVDIAGSFLVPRRLSVILRMTVYGDAIRPKDDLVLAPETRIRR